MATISLKKDANGKAIYIAQAKVTRHDVLVCKESTFSTKQAAEDWVAATERSEAFNNRPIGTNLSKTDASLAFEAFLEKLEDEVF